MSTIQTTNIKHNASASNNITLDSAGSVGIGTASPSGKLDVSSTAQYAGITLSGSGRLWQVGSNSTALVTMNFQHDALAFANYGFESVRITAGGNFQFNSGYGSVATAFGCRAWVNFNGTGTVAIRGSGNVSSITDNGTGDYTVNFTNGMPDANYATVCDASDTGNWGTVTTLVTTLSGSQRIYTLLNNGTSLADPGVVCVAIFR